MCINICSMRCTHEACVATRKKFLFFFVFFKGRICKGRHEKNVGICYLSEEPGIEELSEDYL